MNKLLYLNPNMKITSSTPKQLINQGNTENENNISNYSYPKFNQMGALSFKSSVRLNPKDTISKLLKNTITEMSEKRNYDPNIIDKILSSYVGKNNVRNVPFHANHDIKAGRVKSYRFEDGSIFILEAKINKRGSYIRLYQTSDGKYPINDRARRYYIDKRGHFAENTYDKAYTHLEAKHSAQEWIEKHN